MSSLSKFKKDYIELKEKLSNIASFAGTIEKEANSVWETFDILQVWDDIEPFEEEKSIEEAKQIDLENANYNNTK